MQKIYFSESNLILERKKERKEERKKKERKNSLTIEKEFMFLLWLTIVALGHKNWKPTVTKALSPHPAQWGKTENIDVVQWMF